VKACSSPAPAASSSWRSCSAARVEAIVIAAASLDSASRAKLIATDYFQARQGSMG